MDTSALYTFSYGVFILCAKQDAKLGGCVVNTAIQVSSDPVRVSVAVAKANFTHEMIAQTGLFTLSVLDESVSNNLIAGFGFRSSRACDKFEKIAYKTFENGLPYLTDGVCAALSCRVFSTADAGTHTVFLADALDAVKLSGGNPMTYTYYRAVKKGKNSANSPLTH